MKYPLPQNAARGDGVRLSNWMPDPDYSHCSMRIIEGTDARDIRNRVAFIEKTPRIRVTPYDTGVPEFEDWKKWHSGFKGDDGWDEVSRGWCDQQLLSLGYVVPDPRPYDDSMLG